MFWQNLLINIYWYNILTNKLGDRTKLEFMERYDDKKYKKR